MNLAEFIDETLSEVIAGIRSAQAKSDGTNVAAAMNAAFPTGATLVNSTWGVFTVVDFDVSVIAETSAGGKAAVKVFSALDIGGGAEHKRAEASRIKFSVPIRLPEGDQSRREQSRAASTGSLDRSRRDAD